MDDPDDFLRSLELEQAEVYLAHLEIKIDWEVAAVQAAEILGRNGVEIASNIVTNYEQISTDKSADLQDYSTAYRFSQLTSCIFIKSHLDEDVESNDVAEYESDLIYALMSGSPILDKELRAWLAAFEEVFGVSSLPNKPENNNELRAILLAISDQVQAKKYEDNYKMDDRRKLLDETVIPILRDVVGEFDDVEEIGRTILTIAGIIKQSTEIILPEQANMATEKEVALLAQNLARIKATTAYEGLLLPAIANSPLAKKEFELDLVIYSTIEALIEQDL